MRPIIVVLKKEFRDGIRDRRALMTAMMFPVLAPILIFFMMNAIINMRSAAEENYIPIKGAENAPGLIQWLRERDVRMEKFSGDPVDAVASKRKELVLVIPPSYAEHLVSVKTAVVELINDGSRNDARASVSRIRNLIQRYNREIAALRLITRGVSPEVMRVIEVQNIELASKQQLSATVLNFVPLYIILAGFVSGIGLAVDATAGERERKSLEPLLINPVQRHEIVIGKWLAAGLFASFGMLTTLALCLVAMDQVPLAELGLSFRMTADQAFGMMAATLPLAFLATAMQLLLGIFAKSFKDAQSYIGLLTFLPILPFVITMFKPIATRDWMLAVPILSQHLLLVDVMGGKSLPLSAFLIAAASTLVIGLGLVLLTARLFNRESIVSG